MLISKRIVYKVAVSLLFGCLGFVLNFHTISFQFGDYTVAFLFGLLFPLLIALSWGWKYGLLSALAGGCQAMWWIWGPSNGYAIFLVVPPFTLWIVWHGIGGYLRKKRVENEKKAVLWLSPYFLEIPFRLLNSLNLLTISRWIVSKNPSPWFWSIKALDLAPMSFSIFVVIKQAIVGFVLLLVADVLLNLNPVRAFLKLEPLVDQRRTGYVVSLSLLMGCVFWLCDSIFGAFVGHTDLSFVDFFALNIPGSHLLSRIFVLIFSLGLGVAMSRVLRKQKIDELELSKTKEEAVKREAFLQTLFDTLPDLVWVKDLNGTYLVCNGRVEDYFGMNVSQIIGKNDYDLLNKENAIIHCKHDKLAIAENKPSYFELDAVFASDGHRELLEIIKAPMYDSDHITIGVLGIGRDISERVHLQNQLTHSQKMESVGRLAGGVAHDFNNMLTVILGVSDIVLTKIPVDSPLVNDMTEIQSAAIRSAKLTKQLLAFARKQPMSLQTVDINDSVQSVLEMLNRLMGEHIEREWLPGVNLWPVKIDPDQLDQLLANLCVNAADSIETSGKVTIQSKNRRCDSDFCKEHSGLEPGDYIEISICDTGSGISPEDLEHIFEPFFTRKEVGKGTGLGLATVYGIMKQHQGYVSVESELGKGTCFKLFFPRKINKKDDCIEELHSEHLPHVHSLRGSETVLLVEDERGILEVLNQQLQDLGYRVLSFSNPKEAIEKSQKEREEGRSIDLLITDVIMPLINGQEVSLSVHKFHSDIKTLFISGYTSDVIARQGILEDGLEFLSKPFNQNTLANKVRDVLD